MKSTSLLIAALVVVLPSLAAAQSTGTTSTPRIDKRQEAQSKRIDRGVQSGRLNEKETARLEKGQARVQKAEDKAVADGKVTGKERAHIEHMQDHQSAAIRREKHDRQVKK